MAFIGTAGLTALWSKIKTNFGHSLDGNTASTTYDIKLLDGSGTVLDTQTIPAATASAAGVMTAADRTKLDGIAAGATANTGTITQVKANGTSVATSGVADIPAASTSAYGVTKLSSATDSTSTVLAATPSAVKAAYDLANGKQSPATSLSGYGITDAYTKTEIDTAIGGINDTAVTHTKDTAVGSTTQPVYVDANGVVTATTYSLGKSVPSDAVFTDTKNTAGVYAPASTTEGTKMYLVDTPTYAVADGVTAVTNVAAANVYLKLRANYSKTTAANRACDLYVDDKKVLTSHQDISGKADKQSITAGTAGTSSATSGATLAVPYVTMTAQGVVSGYGTHTHTISGLAASAVSSGTFDNARIPNLTGKTYNGYTLAAACAKDVDTSIVSSSTSTNVPTTKAVVDFVAGQVSGATAFQGTVESNTTIQNASYVSGWYWVVKKAGTYVGQTCEIGDMVFAIANKGTAYSANDFSVVQNNIVEMTTDEVDAICV